jgi:hypothetical protein
MMSDPTDTVAIMAAIIYAGRTGESGQVPNEKVFGLIAKAAWDLHKAVVGEDQVQLGSRAGFQQP